MEEGHSINSLFPNTVWTFLSTVYGLTQLLPKGKDFTEVHPGKWIHANSSEESPHNHQDHGHPGVASAR